MYSVGRVSKETGISPGTLRMWERRYGTPKPMRLRSGHRRYSGEQVRHLRRVAEAMAMGHRPGALLASSEEELARLLEEGADRIGHADAIQPWLEMVRDFRETELNAALRAAIEELDPYTFLEARVSPLLMAIGREWADGRLEVRHEHFTSHVVEDFLRSLRVSLRAQPGRSGRGLILLTTLPGESHSLGLEMAGVLCESMRVRTWMLGTDTPIEQIAASAVESGADVVGLSVSLASGGVRTDSVIGELARALPSSCSLLVGGMGARGNRRKLPGVAYCEDLRELRNWLRAHFPDEEARRRDG